MTQVSGVKARAWRLLDLPRVARFSLLMFCVTLLGNPSCLLTTATDFPEPVPSPPFADANTALATPQGGTGVPVTRILSITDDTELVTLSTDVRSEDLGRDLLARAFVNYMTSARDYFRFGGEGTIPPSTFDEARRISASFKPGSLDLEDGCYQVALVITHEFDRQDLIPVSQDDTAIVVWWMVKGDPAAFNLTKCPSVQPSPDQDAGTDGGGS